MQNKISTKDNKRPNNNPKPKRWHVRWFSPEWVMAFMSIALVLITGFYTYFARDQVRLTRKALAENAEQFSTSLEETRNAVRLEQRAWLGYGSYRFQSRETPTSKWVVRGPEAGEQFRVQFYINNVGKTPAINVRIMEIHPTLVPIGTLAEEPEEWHFEPSGSTIFPNTDGIYHSSQVMHMSNQEYSEYSNGEKEIFFWAKFYYCDINGRRHWTQIGVARAFGSNDFNFRSSSISPYPGEADHKDCQDHG